MSLTPTTQKCAKPFSKLQSAQQQQQQKLQKPVQQLPCKLQLQSKIVYPQLKKVMLLLAELAPKVGKVKTGRWVKNISISDMQESKATEI